MLNWINLQLKKASILGNRSIQTLNRSDGFFSGSKRYCFGCQADILAAIDLSILINSGIQGIILDLDNTIISEDDRYLSPGVEAWIEQAKALKFGLFLLSNGKRRFRVKDWSERLDIPAISPAKKPFPFAFRQALTAMQLRPKQVVVIGDSRHTDVLGAWLIGCPSIQTASLPHPPRWWERILGKYLQKPYPLELHPLELWHLKAD